jgi:hypothetical protein
MPYGSILLYPGITVTKTLISAPKEGKGCLAFETQE